MSDQRTPEETVALKRLQLRRRAKRGLVAGYIHELSERHNRDRRRETERARMRESTKTS